MNDAETGRGGLEDRLPSVEPPPELERRVRRTLVSRGLIAAPNAGRASFSVWVFRVGLVAAGIVIGLLAAWRTDSARPAQQDSAGQYVLLLYGDPADDTGSVHIAREREYGQWASSLTDGARWVGGHELHDVVAALGPGPIQGPGPGRLAGYFVIDAPNRERAAEVARSCPHLKYGGTVVVMSIAS